MINRMRRTASTDCLLPLPATKEWGEGKVLAPIKAPNSKLQISSKSQAPRQRVCTRFWNLKFGISVELGVWDLVFRSLTSRQEPIHSLSRHSSPWPSPRCAGRGYWRRRVIHPPLSSLWLDLELTHRTLTFPSSLWTPAYNLKS